MIPRKFIPEQKSTTGLFHLIGISCHCRDYQLCFHLQKKLDLEFTRLDDLKDHSFFFFKDDNEFNRYYLLGNRHEASFLIPEYRQMDFILLIEGPFKKAQREHFLKEIKTIPNVLIPVEIKMETIKNPDLLLNDLEMHISGIINSNQSDYLSVN